MLLPLLGFGPHVFSRVPGGGPRYFEQGAGFLLPGAGLLLPLPDMLGHRPQHRLVRIRGGRHPRYGLLHHTRGGGPQRGHVRRMLGVHLPHRLVGRKLVRAPLRVRLYRLVGRKLVRAPLRVRLCSPVFRQCSAACCMIVGRKLVSSPTARAFVLTRLLSLSRGALAPRTLCCWARGFRVRSAYGARLGVKLPPCRMAARPRQSPAALARGPFRCACAVLHSSSPSRPLLSLRISFADRDP